MLENNLKDRAIRIFVFGTLRKGGRLDYYMDGSRYAGKYYTEGQLMKSEIGSAYIDFKYKAVATHGELHYINYPGLLRIDHLEAASGEFPKGYDLDLIPIWEYEDGKDCTFDEADKQYAFFYKRRNDPLKVSSGDWINRPKPVKEICKYLREHPKSVEPDALIKHMIEYLGIS